MSLPATNDRSPRTLPGAVAWLLLGCLGASLWGQVILEDESLARSFMSRPLWHQVVDLYGGQVEPIEEGRMFATVPLGRIAIVVALGMAAVWLGGAFVIARLSKRPYIDRLVEWGSQGWKWWSLLGLWYVLWLLSTILAWDRVSAFLAASVELWRAIVAAGWMATGIGLAASRISADGGRRWPGWVPVTVGMAVYTIVFTWMNWRLYDGLLIPHGDSAMYEEHLWNITHGKGFRSYLDQGLFLGEHIQFIHLGLLPVYLLWPSHLLLELCESLALAMTALPVYWIARRHSGSDRAAVWLAVGTLLYFPLQYLDIAIDLKTFRPISFGVPLLLFAIDQMERRRWWSMLGLLLVTLTAKEDFAIVIAPLGVWLAMTTWWRTRCETNAVKSAKSTVAAESAEPTVDHRPVWIGAAMALFATGYLLLCVKVLIPWFRGGETVHYARYFSQFGETPVEIATNMLTNPGLLIGQFVTIGSLLYFLRVMLPLGGLPLLSPSRLFVGAPLFLLLCLNELAQETPAPVHHFHAPLLPIVFWATAASLPNMARLWHRRRSQNDDLGQGDSRQKTALVAGRFAGLCALATGLVMGMSPLSLKFWDAGQTMSWRPLYVPGQRAAEFAKIAPLIPPSARVASTDFVHPRFTHHERSYDYSGYLRKVAGYEQRVPDDTDVIVIDTRHRYSTMHTPEDVPEYHDTEHWELLTTDPDPWFIVLRRRE